MRLAAGEHAEGSSISVISWAVVSSAIFVFRKAARELIRSSMILECFTRPPAPILKDHAYTAAVLKQGAGSCRPRPMLPAIPSAYPATTRAHADAKSTKTATLDAEVQQEAIFFDYEAASGGTCFLKSRLSYWG
jgi:hypothetical protein